MEATMMITKTVAALFMLGLLTVAFAATTKELASDDLELAFNVLGQARGNLVIE
jgi:hypothetical protein